jgi:Uma2 family endonuclease
MSVAMGTQAGETRIRFPGVGFHVYETLINATPPRTAIRMAYDGKDLEIMVKGPVHDNFGRLLDRFITAIAVELGIRFEALGETTWIRPEIERGLEADQCYVFDANKLATVKDALGRKINDVAAYPNPDLAVEVDISHPQADRPGIYAALQVPELWVFDGASVVIEHLGSDGGYHDAGQSRWLPVHADEATRWLVDEDTREKPAWEERVRGWARGELVERLKGGE